MKCATWSLLALTSALTVFAILLHFSTFPRSGTLSTKLVSQEREWANLEWHLSRVASSCGSLAPDNATLIRLRGSFLHYQNGTNAFLSTVNTSIPEALRSNSCSDFITNSQLAILQANAMADSLIRFDRVLSDNLMTSDRRKEILNKSSTASLLFTNHTQGVLTAMWYGWSRSIIGLWNFNVSGEEPHRIHYEYGIKMLASRKCLYNTRITEKKLEPLLFSLGRSVESFKEFAAESMLHARAWEQVGKIEIGQCTQKHLDVMKQHYVKMSNIVLPGSDEAFH